MKHQYLLLFLILLLGSSCQETPNQKVTKPESLINKESTKNVDDVDLVTRLMADLVENPNHQFYLDRNKIVNYCIDHSINAQKTEHGIYYLILEEGNGEAPKYGDEISVHYLGKTLEGREVDSSYKRGKPYRFALHSVIQGWLISIPMLKKGGKGVFLIPSALAYGEEGFPEGSIPPHEPLIFEIELIDIHNKN